MGRRLRLGGLAAAACLVLMVAAACGSSAGSSGSSASPSAAGSARHADRVRRRYAVHAVHGGAAAFKKQNPGVTVHSQFGASGDMVKNITQLHQPADVLGVADYSLIPKLMFTGSKPFATWYVGFVSNQITFAYTSHSKGASQLTAVQLVQGAGPARRAHRPVQPGRGPLGLPDPADAPAGQRLLPPPEPVRLGAEELP